MGRGQIGHDQDTHLADASCYQIPMTDSRIKPPSSAVPPRRRVLLNAVVRVATANAIFTLLTFVTSPIIARALGPSGRGHLAAITVPFMWASLLSNLGFPSYAARAAARKTELGPLIGTLGLASLGLCLLGWLAGIPLAHVLAPHDAQVHEFILIGLVLLPVTLLASIGIGVVNGLEQWTRLNLARITPPIVALILYVALALSNQLTVASAASVVYISTVATMLPLVGLLRLARPLRFSRG